MSLGMTLISLVKQIAKGNKSEVKSLKGLADRKFAELRDTWARSNICASSRIEPTAWTSSEVPVVAASWSMVDLADGVERLLDDPVLRRAQVSATLAAADRYSWRHTVDGFVSMYRALLARPAR